MNETPTPEQVIRESFERAVKQGTEARAEAVRVVTDYRVDQMWSMNDFLIVAARGEYAQELLDRAENAEDKGKSFTDVLAWTQESITTALLAGYLESNSTSGLSNALTDAKREAARQFLREVDSAIRFLTTQDEDDS